MANGYSAYTQNQSTGETVRETEARALMRCAGRMEAVQKEGTGYLDYCEAVRQNQKLWTFFQASLIGEESAKLPADLTDILKSLSIYVDRRSMRAYAEFQPGLLDVLININKQIAAGLMQREEAEAAALQRQQSQAASTSMNLNIG